MNFRLYIHQIMANNFESLCLDVDKSVGRCWGCEKWQVTNFDKQTTCGLTPPFFLNVSLSHSAPRFVERLLQIRESRTRKDAYDYLNKRIKYQNKICLRNSANSAERHNNSSYSVLMYLVKVRLLFCNSHFFNLVSLNVHASLKKMLRLYCSIAVLTTHQ